MPELLEPQDIMFTPFEPKLKNRFIMQIDGINAYLIINPFFLYFLIFIYELKV